MAQVPATSYESTSLGDVAEFTIPFPFLSRAEVFVTVDGAQSAFTWINDGLIQLPEIPELGAIVRRYRSTTAYVPLHQFSQGVPFLPRYVDRDFTQTLYAVQESVNDTAGTAALALDTAELALDTAQSALDLVGERTQYMVLGPYGPGLYFQTNSQVFSYLGEFYAPGPSITLPYTTTGVGAAEIANFRSVGDAVLRQDLGEESDPARGASLVGGLIANSLTLNVPSDHPTLNAALDYLRGYTIARGAVVTVQVADGTYSLLASVNLNHPQGANLRVIGNQSNPALCVLVAADGSAFDALVCSDGHVLGLLDGFTVVRPSKAEWPFNYTGVLAVRGALITCGTKVRVDNWFYGIAARYGSVVHCPQAIVTDAGDVGIWAYNNSLITCDGAVSNGASAAGYPWGFGFQAEFGSVLNGTGISASGCKIGGVAALSNSTVRAHDVTASGNIGSGLFVRDDAIIDSQGASTTNGNGRYGFEVLEGRGYVNTVATNTGNTLGATNPFPFLTVTGGQAALSASGGSLRVDSQGATFFNTPGGLQFEVLNIASAVNHPYAAGAATGGAARVGATGSDANVDLILEPKGTGKVRFGATQAIPGGFTENSIIEIKAADGAVVQIRCKRL